MDRLLDYSINHPLLAGGLLLMTFVVIGYELRQRGAMSSAVGPGEAIRLVNSGAVLVDLRSANLFKDGHITGAKNVPGDQIAADPKTLEKLAAKTIVLYCDDGATTAAAQRTLARAGAKDVFSLRGGLAAWKQENLPVVKG
ncbi:MAG TPA: rhodanese-like domain-containing protein [Steroidobacteraceae bacterium]|jgi:rhodanese-related sulfurtransferase